LTVPSTAVPANLRRSASWEVGPLFTDYCTLAMCCTTVYECRYWY
jgi:hypothetical protein